MTTLVLIALFTLAYTTAAAAHKPRTINQHRLRVVASLDRGLAGTPMRNTGRQLEASGHKWNVHPAFIAAVAAVESTFGLHVCGQFNAWGLGSCGRSWSPPSFRSWAHAYDFYARWLRERWPRARSAYDFHGYCVTSSGADCPRWAGLVAGLMRSRFAVGSAVSYR